MAKKVDPVCGMTVGDDTSFKSEYQGKEYYFCAQHCKEKFDANPLKFTR